MLSVDERLLAENGEGIMKESFFERLQYASESDSLDFKKAQYKFSGASDIEKSELLKDILAMVNAWSTETRHIVIGIEERNPKPNCYHGVHDFIDDSRIQEFVNSKTSRVCLFDWLTCAYKGKDYTVIRWFKHSIVICSTLLVNTFIFSN